MDFLTASDSWAGRVLFERGLAILCFVAFLVARNQFPALLGERGLLPVPDYLRHLRFSDGPSLFHWHYSDRLLAVVAWTGMAGSAAIACGALAAAPAWACAAAWLGIAFLYLSIVNVGQRFYAFGWESLLVEAAFFAAFLGPQWMEPSIVPVLLLRWLLFRLELGAGLIKIRAGGPWRDRTALYYHHETQPMPNPLSRYAHRLPRRALRGGVLFSHFVQLVVPFGLFLPQPGAGIAALLVIGHQLLLIAFGNYAWLNWITVVLGFCALPDGWLAWSGLESPGEFGPRPTWWEGLLVAIALATAWLSVPVVRNLFSRRQVMNGSFNRWRIVNTYGAFGAVTQERYEIVIEGTADLNPKDEGKWKAYEFKGKPGDVSRPGPVVAPYHLRLDWLMWFLPLAVQVVPGGISKRGGTEQWFVALLGKLFENDPAVVGLLRHNPFPGEPPRFLRARFFRYRFAEPGEKAVWSRSYVGDYVRAVSREDYRHRP